MIFAFLFESLRAVRLLDTDEFRFNFRFVVCGIVGGVILRLMLNYHVRPILTLVLQKQEQEISEQQRARLMGRVNNRTLRSRIASLQRQLHYAMRRGEPGTKIMDQMVIC